jgi:hypothetical protein
MDFFPLTTKVIEGHMRKVGRLESNEHLLAMTLSVEQPFVRPEIGGIKGRWMTELNDFMRTGGTIAAAPIAFNVELHEDGWIIELTYAPELLAHRRAKIILDKFVSDIEKLGEWIH